MGSRVLPEIFGTKTADNLQGNAQDSIIYGWEGDDTLVGGTGNDILIGGTGKDALDGGVGIDTVSYFNATSGVTVDLNAGIATRTAKLMPLGDSITYGFVSDVNPDSGGYRLKLSELLQANGISIDFVGSLSNGPTTLRDKDHEGHGGWTIDQIDGKVNEWLNTAQPDVVLLTIGTNDTYGDSVGQMSQELSNLIDKIVQYSPDTYVFVATIPPTNNQERVQKIAEYNAAIPGIVEQKLAEGKKVKFVDMSSLTTDDISRPPDDNGLHPTTTGYSKIASLWYEALQDLGISQGTFAVDRDTLVNIEYIDGSSYNDTLIGNAVGNAIAGDAGADVLTGGGGRDVFVYRSYTDGGDTITDFNATDDLIQFSANGFGGGLTAGVMLSLTAAATGTFVSGNNPQSLGNNANFLYDTATGILSFDVDGIGANSAVTIAQFNGLPNLNPTQISIVA
ncbi:GDSL-type esterase/lipase family protein [Chroococcidiopsis sp. CCNUC1]|uniref:GDSL-type esterase/lipase family protein n=1 Tax=Chroococcidiopsis sp. CCNUC1 TaxID=2653189 RepID=UPI0020208AC3|nr:GDSL-type esterase/lipase family protein [Chroococcidiopsis sp. CCNUC1]URD51102.1 GDSL-type esterase/lipase family protein [Chroococcidiopsis sp. CCNUC1]